MIVLAVLVLANKVGSYRYREVANNVANLWHVWLFFVHLLSLEVSVVTMFDFALSVCCFIYFVNKDGS